MLFKGTPNKISQEKKYSSILIKTLVTPLKFLNSELLCKVKVKYVVFVKDVICDIFVTLK